MKTLRVDYIMPPAKVPDNHQYQSVCVLSHCDHVPLFVTPWTVAHKAPLYMRFSRQEYWSGVPFPPPEDLPDPGIEPTSLASSALAGMFFIISATWEASAIRHVNKRCFQMILTLSLQVFSAETSAEVSGSVEQRLLFQLLPF